MARSFKKAIYKDSSKERKTYSNRRFRRKVKIQIQKKEFETFPKRGEITNQWDVCDWVFYVSDFWKDDEEKIAETIRNNRMKKVNGYWVIPK